MAGSNNGDEDESIKPVSSLRSKFEHLSTAPSTSAPPPVAKKPATLTVPAEPPERQRSSLDMPRPKPWELLQGSGQKAGSSTPTLALPPLQSLAPRNPVPHRQRPVSMGPWSPPRSPPLSSTSNPFSPASITTDDGATLPQPNVTSAAVQSTAADHKSSLRNKPAPPPPLKDIKLPLSGVEIQRALAPHSPAGLKKPPPPINRSNKPSTPGLTAPSNLAPIPDVHADEAISPFNTPPSSNGSPEKGPSSGKEKQRTSYFPNPPAHYNLDKARGSAGPPRTIPIPKTRRTAVPNQPSEQSDHPSDRPQLPTRHEAEPVAPVTVHVMSPPRQQPEHKKKISALPPPRPQELRNEQPKKEEFLPPPRRVVTGPTKEDPHAPGKVAAGTRLPPHQHRIASDPVTTTSSRASSAQGYHSEMEGHLLEDAQNKTGLSSYPDATKANRRPPKLPGMSTIYPDYDTRQFDICGQYCCTIGYFVKVYNTATGRLIYEHAYQERDMKATAIVFKPGASTDEEGKVIWIGNNVGEIQEVNLPSQRVALSRSNAHSRREIVKMYRHQNSIWSVDEEGKFNVWMPDSKGIPNLQKQPSLFRVARGHTFSIMVKRFLWYACGKEIRIYNPMGGENNFHVTTYALTQHSAGEITSGAVVSNQLDRVYFGHSDGKVSIYSTDYQCLGVVSVSSYKINTMTGAGNCLWAGFNTGKICVYDTKTNPWIVKKDWHAHNSPVASLVADQSGVWRSGTLPVASIGLDKTISIWDGWLETDWLETDMQDHDAEFCEYREIKAMVCTWNAGASTPGTLRAEDRDSNFFREIIRTQDPPDLLVFGFQELVDLEDKKLTAKTLFKGSKKKDATDHEHMSRQYRAWRDYLSRVIEDYMPSQQPYTLLQTANLVGLFSCIFVKSSERARISDVQVAEVKRGLGGLHGNKGAIIVRFVMDNTSLCFTNCHLAAGQNHTTQRNDDITAILESSGLPKEGSMERRLDTFIGGGDGTQVMDHEICVINGDMNYRIDTMGRDTVVKAVNSGNLARLLERDQLLVAKRRNPTFRLRAFHEQQISFAPTYKYDVGTDRYDTSEKSRSPAWCDRILYRGAGRIRQLDYRRHEGIRVSDHRPVSGTFTMRIKQIRSKQRAKVWEQCEQRLVVEKQRYAKDAKLDYLVSVLGVEPKEAVKLLAH